MVDTLSETIDSSGKEESAAAATNSSKLKSIFRRESFKNMGKVLSGKMHSSNLDPTEEDEEMHQDLENKNKSHTKPTKNWMKDRFKKQNKEQTTEDQRGYGTSRDFEMDELHLSSRDEEITEGNNLLSGYPATTSQQPAARQQRPASHNSYSFPQTLSTAVDVDDQTDSIQMNEKQLRKYNQKMCMSVALAVILVAGVVLGIVLWAMSSVGLAFQILGPTIFGLSLFALVYKMFLTIIWKEDPYQYFQRRFKRLNKTKNPI